MPRAPGTRGIAGQITLLAADGATAQSSWCVTTSPFITKEDFER
jgi:hypothetical protein